MYSWSLSHASGMDSSENFWKLEIFPLRVLVLLMGKNLAKIATEHFSHVSTVIKPLFRLSGEGKGKQTEPDAVLHDVLDDDGVAKLKEVLKVGVGILAWQAI